MKSQRNTAKDQLLDIYDRLLELYVLVDEDDTKSESLQPEIDRLRCGLEHLKRVHFAVDG